MTQVIQWTKPLIDDLRDKLEYLERIDAPDTDTFMFHGHEFNHGYAKYLFEYLNTRYNKIK